VTSDRARELLSQITGLTVAEGGPAVTVHVPTEQLASVAAFVKETIGCAFFAFSTAIDHKADGLETVAYVENLDHNITVVLRSKLGAGNICCPSLVPVYRGANWMERETYDMFGVQFEGHPDLRRILLSDDWDGHPLLKSYAVDTPYPPYR